MNSKNNVTINNATKRDECKQKPDVQVGSQDSTTRWDYFQHAQYDEQQRIQGGDTGDMSPHSDQVKEKNGSRSSKRGTKFKKFSPSAPIGTAGLQLLEFFLFICKYIIGAARRGLKWLQLLELMKKYRFMKAKSDFYNQNSQFSCCGGRLSAPQANIFT